MPGTHNLKPVHSYSSGQWIRCNWFECDKTAYTLFKAVKHDHAPEVPCNSAIGIDMHVNVLFCSDKHKQYYLNSHVSLWNLPSGMKNI